MEAEAVMDALLQNATQLPVPLQHQNFFRAVLISGIRGRKASRATANNNNVVQFHYRFTSGAAFL